MGLLKEVKQLLAGPMTPKFLVTADNDGNPNVVPIMSITPISDDKLAFADFMIWKTAQNLRENPRVGVLVFSEDLKYAHIRGTFKGFEKTGDNFNLLSSAPDFKYNAYSGIRSAGVIEVESCSEVKSLSKVSLAAGLFRLKLHKPCVNGTGSMPRQVMDKFRRAEAVKVISYLDSDGCPVAVPVLTLTAKAEGSLSLTAGRPVNRLPDGTKVAVNVLTREPISYQVKGILRGTGGTRDIELTDVYSACPPLVGKKIG